MPVSNWPIPYLSLGDAKADAILEKCEAGFNKKKEKKENL